MPESATRASAALLALIVSQTVMLMSFFAGVPPHPPAETPLFGIAPFVGAALATASAAIVLGSATPAGRVVTLVAALMAAVSFGPQKYFDPNFSSIWPTVIVGQVAIVSLLIDVVRARRGA